MLLSRLPRLRDPEVRPEQAFAGTFHVNEGYAQLETAYRQAASGRIPAPAPCDVYCHSLADPSILSAKLQAAGAQTLTVFALHMPARLFRADPAGALAEAKVAVLASLDSVLAEPIEECLLEPDCIEVMGPLEIETELGMPGGHIFHGDLQWPFAETASDVGRWGVETEHANVFVCGAGARRGGGVSAIPGRNAAMAALTSPAGAGPRQPRVRWACPRRRVARFGDGEDDELGGADVDEALDRVGRARPIRPARASRVVEIGAATGELGQQHVGHVVERVGDEHAEVVVLDRPVVLGGDLLDHRPSRGGVTGGDERRQPPVGEAADAAQLRRGDTAEPHVEPGRLRPHLQPGVVEALAVVVDDSENQHARITASASSNQRARSPRSTPNAWCSRASATPRPNAGSSRPPDITASVASSLASTTGLRPGSTSTLMPNFRCVVRPAAYDIATTGSGASPPIRSDSHRLSKPSRSSESTTSPNSGPCSRVRVPSPTPMRTFTPNRLSGTARRRRSRPERACASTPGGDGVCGRSPHGGRRVIVAAGVPAEGEPDDHDGDHDQHRRHADGQVEGNGHGCGEHAEQDPDADREPHEEFFGTNLAVRPTKRSVHRWMAV